LPASRPRSPAVLFVRTEPSRKLPFSFRRKIEARKIKNVKAIFCEAVPLGGTAAGRSDWIFSEIFGKVSSSGVV